MKLYLIQSEPSLKCMSKQNTHIPKSTEYPLVGKVIFTSTDIIMNSTLRKRDCKFQSCRINKSWRCNMQHGDNSKQYCNIYLQFAKRIDLKMFSLQKQKL